MLSVRCGSLSKPETDQRDGRSGKLSTLAAVRAHSAFVAQAVAMATLLLLSQIESKQ